MRKEVKKINSFSPAWIEDVNYASNPGYIKFKNGFINDIGKVQKRKGLKTILRHSQDATPPGQEGGIPLVFNYPAAGSNSCPRPNVLHVKVKQATTGETQKYVLKHNNYNSTNVLDKYVFDSTDAQSGASVQIGSSAQFKNFGPVKFIETPDQVYIINTFQKLTSGRKQGFIWKYAYGENLKQFDTDRLHNMAVYSNITGRATVVKNTFPTVSRGLAEGKYQYLIMPLYNTGTVGRYDNNNLTPPIDVEIKMTTAEKQASTYAQVKIEVYSLYDPYIIAYRIYRTKVGKTVAEDGAYFVVQIDKPANKQNPAEWVVLQNTASSIAVTDIGTDGFAVRTVQGSQNGVTVPIPTNIPRNAPPTTEQIDAVLGDAVGVVPFINTQASPFPAQTFAIADTYPAGFNVDCGTFADNRLILGYGKNIYFSLIDKTDSLDALLTLIMPLAHETENPATAIEQVGPWVYVFCRTCIYKLMPTSNASAPYQLQLVSGSYGSDNISVVVQNNIAYFMFNKRLHAMNAYGQIKPIAGPIESVFLAATDDIFMSKNDKEGYIKIMFRISGASREVNFYPEKNMYVDLTGYRDIFAPVGGNEVALKIKDERLRLLAYEFNSVLNEGWGITFDGDLVKESSAYEDETQASAVKNWQDYQFYGTIPPVTNKYGTELEFIKSFTYSERVNFPSAILSGTGTVYVSYAIDASDTYSEEKAITLKKDGVETVIDAQGFTCKLRIRHNDTVNIDLDYFGVKVTSQGKVDYMNTVSNGG